ncbi:MAG: deoxyribodipyrimidine photo-lyase [Algoriphagus sp.]|nr:deoxyribodipyrimidine photo-lyase [Algoriphagus sp.]
MKYNRVLVWFRNDLRVKDNEVLTRAILQGKEVIPVYCLDPRMFEKTQLGFPKTGSFRAKFLLEAISDLRQSFRKLGGDLVILQGNPEASLIDFAKQAGAKAIFFSKEVTSEERNVDKSLEKAAFANGIACESFWHSTLYHLDDLPFPAKQTPEVFTQFRKEVEKQSKIRLTYPEPKKINYPSEVINSQAGELPNLKTYGLEEPKQDVKSWLEIKGGETSALGRLRSYFLQGNPQWAGWDGLQLQVFSLVGLGLYLSPDYL